LTLDAWLRLAEAFAADSLALFSLRYVLIAGGLSLVLRVLGRGPLRARRLQREAPTWRMQVSEIFWSLSTTLIFVAQGLWLFWLYGNGYTRFYTDAGTYGRLYLVLSVPAMLLLHDLYFYVTHRLMHDVAPLRRLHVRHHRSHTPSPWAVFSFSPGEAVIESGIYALIVFVLPVHPAAFTAFVTLATLWGAYVHCGYELLPLRWAHARRPWLLCATHHDHHHARGRDNYALYLAIWDRLLPSRRHPRILKAIGQAARALRRC
jgi:sterol desaturase/sphingolipid hydroxylase (fatty acid hydroxylase superfamily)